MLTIHQSAGYSVMNKTDKEPSAHGVYFIHVGKADNAFLKVKYVK